MSISVIIPSALRQAPDGESWLARALRSVAAQTKRPAEVVVGLDPGDVFPPDLIGAHGLNVGVARGARKGHQAACNAAAALATGRLLAFLEDDDLWLPHHLATLAAAMERHGADLVTCSQAQVTPDGSPLPRQKFWGGIDTPEMFHFPTCSGWLMTRLLWVKLGGFDCRWRWHHDNEFLGRVNLSGARRVHLVPEGTAMGHPWLGPEALARFSPIEAVAGLREATVLRTVHPGSIMADINRGGGKAERSAKEYAALEILYGRPPW